jgi:hypothetical protein
MKPNLFINLAAANRAGREALRRAGAKGWKPALTRQRNDDGSADVGYIVKLFDAQGLCGVL